MYRYDDIRDASKGLLLEAILALNTIDLEYLIVGGWASYLRNETSFPHPGTKDVDILFSDGNIKGKIEQAIEAFLNNGFLISAKHDFQMFKVLNVQGKKVVYHIDLLHPQETKNNPELMVDHFDLGLSENDTSPNNKIQKSIALPSSKFLFSGFHNNIEFNHFSSKGKKQVVTIPLIDEAGLIFSKCKSAQIEKRPRDSYDLFLALVQPNVLNTINKLKKASNEYSAVKESIESLLIFVGDKENHFEYNILKYLDGHEYEKPREYCLSKLQDIVSA